MQVKNDNKYSKNTGVRFYRSRFDKNLTEKSLFDYIFSHVYDEFKSMIVLCDSIWLPDEEDEPELFKQIESHVLIKIQEPIGFSGGVLPIYGPRMPEFEGGSVLMVESVPSISTWREFELFDSEQIDSVHTLISNYDGAFWEIYSEDSNIVSSLVEKHCRDEMLELFLVDYELDTGADPIRHYSELETYRIQ